MNPRSRAAVFGRGRHNDRREGLAEGVGCSATAWASRCRARGAGLPFGVVPAPSEAEGPLSLASVTGVPRVRHHGARLRRGTTVLSVPGGTVIAMDRRIRRPRLTTRPRSGLQRVCGTERRDRSRRMPSDCPGTGLSLRPIFTRDFPRVRRQARECRAVTSFLGRCR